MENHEIFGELDSKGRVVRNVRFTAEPEGLRFESGDAMVGIDGTPYFYYVKAAVFSRLTQEARDEIESRVRKPLPAAVQVAPVESVAPRQKPETKKDVTNDNSSN